MAIHLLNPLWDASGGSEWRTVSLYKELAPHADVNIWTEYTPDPLFTTQFPVQEMLKLQDYPRGGTFVFIGAYWEIGRWMSLAQPDRVILTYNVKDPDGLEYRIEQLESYGVKNIELVFPSEMFAQYANGRRGTVEFSPIDFDAFSPAKKKPSDAVTIGRHSRDQAFKHHPNDPTLYRQLAGQGFEIRILGGMSLDVSDVKGIELLPANSIPAEQFLKELDIFFYRTDPSWLEPYGRVIAEAMGSGLPCVVENRGGYTSLIRHGENGFLFSSREDAVQILTQLKADPDLRRRIGSAARADIVALYASKKQALLDYYLRTA